MAWFGAATSAGLYGAAEYGGGAPKFAAGRGLRVGVVVTNGVFGLLLLLRLLSGGEDGFGGCTDALLLDRLDPNLLRKSMLLWRAREKVDECDDCEWKESRDMRIGLAILKDGSVEYKVKANGWCR